MTTPTTVGHINLDAHWRPGPNDVYIGRRMARYGLRASPVANPYRIGKHGTREDVLRLFRRYFRESRHDLHPYLPALRGRRLLCWCHTEAGVGDECHGDWLAALADGRIGLGDDWDGAALAHGPAAIASEAGTHLLLAPAAVAPIPAAGVGPQDTSGVAAPTPPRLGAGVIDPAPSRSRPTGHPTDF